MSFENEILDGCLFSRDAISERKLEPTISVIIFLQFTMFPCKINLLQVKRNLISSIINFAYELPHKLRNDLKLRILGILEMKRKPQNGLRYRLVSPFQKFKTYAKANITVLVQFCLIFLLFARYFVSN